MSAGTLTWGDAALAPGWYGIGPLALPQEPLDGGETGEALRVDAAFQSAQPPRYRDTFSVRVILWAFAEQGMEQDVAIWLDGLLRALQRQVVRTTGCECPRAGATADHVHLAIRLSRTITIAQLVEELKTASSKWLKAQSPELARFAWQRGYGVFSTGPADLEVLLAYIDNQEEHHRTHTFQDEFRAFLMKYRIEYDERYVWD